MKVSKENILTLGLRGKIEDFVFFERYKVQLARKAPPKSYNKIATSGQKPVRNHLNAATAFAKEEIRDPEKKAGYTLRANGERSAYTQAIKEYLQKLREEREKDKGQT